MVIVHRINYSEIRELPCLSSYSLLIGHGIPGWIYAYRHFSRCSIGCQHAMHFQQALRKDKLSKLPANGMEGVNDQQIRGIGIGEGLVFTLGIFSQIATN